MSTYEHKAKRESIDELGALRESDDVIDEGMRSERALREEREFTDIALDAQVDTFFLFEPATGKALRWNRSFSDISGYTDQEIAELPAPTSYYSPDDLARANTFVQEVLAEGTGTIAMDLICKDGRTVPTEYKVSVIHDEIGEAKYIISVGRDITERQQAERALRRSLSRSEALFEHAAIPIWEEDFSEVREYIDHLRKRGVADFDRYLRDHPEEVLRMSSLVRVRGVNRKSLEFYEADSVEELSRFLPDWFMEQSLDVFRDELVALAGGADRFEGEIPVRTPEGEIKHLHVNLSLLPDHEVPWDRVFVSFVDLTEYRRAEQAREELQAHLRQAQRMEAVGQLAGGVAHDFNNVLTVITSYAELALEEVPEGDSVKADVRQILAAADQGAALTSQLLAFGRKQIIRPSLLDLNEIIRNHEKMLRRVIREDIIVSTSLGDDLWRIHADPAQIEQVLMNLAINARDAMPSGGRLTIEAGNAELDEQFAKSQPGGRAGSYVKLAVTDTGHGMSPEVKERLFEPFFTTKKHGQGTGLGLSTVYGIVKQNDGNIWVASEPGRGTTVTVYLPRAIG